jgi:hypothetical protein
VQHWQKAVGYGQQLIALNAADPDIISAMAIAYYDLKDTAHAQQFAQQSIDMSKAAGKQPDPNMLQIVMAGQVGQNNQAGAQQTLEQIYITSGDSHALSQLIDIAFSTQGMSGKSGEIYGLDLLRLKIFSGVAESDDYMQLANSAYLLGYGEEGYRVLQQAMAAGKASKVGDLLSKTRNDANIDEKGLPKIASDAARAKAGEQDVKLAEDYWGYARYADAEAAARRAIAKGGIKDPAEGPLILGMALLAQGKYDEAIQTFGQVGGSAAAQKTAHLWSLYAQAKKGSAPAAPAH